MGMSIRERRNECIKTSTGTMWLPVGRLSYAHLFEKRLPPGETDEKKAKYQTSIIFPPSADLKPLKNWIAEVAREKWGDKIKGVRNPILSHAEKANDSDLAREFPILIRTATEKPPTVAFPSGEECKEKQQAYSGRWARVSVRLYPWSHPTGGKGVSVGLSNVVLLEDDTPLGGTKASLEDEFKGVFDVEAPGENNRSADAAFDEVSDDADDLFK